MTTEYRNGPDAMELDEAGNYYCRHVHAMTAEALERKSEIAAELGRRDMRCDVYKAALREIDALVRDSLGSATAEGEFPVVSCERANRILTIISNSKE